MASMKDLEVSPATVGGDGGNTSVSLGKGAWDCDANCEITPEKEARPCRPSRCSAAKRAVHCTRRAEKGERGRGEGERCLGALTPLALPLPRAGGGV